MSSVVSEAFFDLNTMVRIKHHSTDTSVVMSNIDNFKQVSYSESASFIHPQPPLDNKANNLKAKFSGSKLSGKQSNNLISHFRKSVWPDF